MVYTQLGKTALRVSKLGFGTAPLGDVYGAVTEEEAIALVHYAIEQGINFFDSSPLYGGGLAESRLGKALLGYREDVVIATKGGHFVHGFDYSFKAIYQTCLDSLERLQSDYIDVYLLHDIEAVPKEQILAEALPALYTLREEGRLRFIGVSGFPLALLQDLAVNQGLDVLLSYCHYTLLNQGLDAIAALVKAKGIGLINASVTHMGLLTDQGEPDWHPAETAVKQAARQAAHLCQKHGVSLAQLATHFAFANPLVDITLLGVRSRAELATSLEVLHSSVDQELLKAVQAILAPVLNRPWADKSKKEK